MIVIDMLAWWYAMAWMQVLYGVQQRTMGVLEAFSVGLLARTLFAPFRQIDAGSVRGPINIQIRAWFDRTFSRLFGAVVRTVMIMCGCICAVTVFTISLLWAAFWLLIPVLPVFGVILTVVG
jgi:hypothetical protein